MYFCPGRHGVRIGHDCLSRLCSKRHAHQQYCHFSSASSLFATFTIPPSLCFSARTRRGVHPSFCHDSTLLGWFLRSWWPLLQRCEGSSGRPVTSSCARSQHPVSTDLRFCCCPLQCLHCAFQCASYLQWTWATVKWYFGQQASAICSRHLSSIPAVWLGLCGYHRHWLWNFWNVWRSIRLGQLLLSRSPQLDC